MTFERFRLRLRRLALPMAGALLLGLIATAAPLAGAPAHAAQGLPAATADGAVSWGVRPADSPEHGEARPNYAYEVEAGAVIDDALVVSNYSPIDITLRVYAADAFTGADGALDLLLPGEPSTDLGAWTVSSASQVTVPAGASIEVPFTITVPRNATPGDHAGGIVTSLGAERGEDGITVDRRLGSRIHLRVAGELAPALAIESFSISHTPEWNPFGAGTAEARFTIANTGNVRLYGDQLISAAGAFGIAEQIHDTELREILPGERRTVTVMLDAIPPLFWITGQLELQGHEAGGDHSHAHEAEVIVTADAVGLAVPWSALGVLLLLTGAVLLALWLRRRAKTAAERKVAEAVAAALAGVGPADKSLADDAVAIDDVADGASEPEPRQPVGVPSSS